MTPSQSTALLSDEQIYALAKQHLGDHGHDLIWQNDPSYAAATEMPQDARWSISAVRSEQTMAFARAVLAAAHGWRPIETAPKDGTEFLAWFPKLRLDDDGYATTEVVGGHQAIVTCKDGQWDEPTWLDASGAYYFDDWCFAELPTFWQPLPPPPDAAATAPEQPK